VEQGRSGFLFTQEDEFRTNVDRLLRDPQLRHHMGAIGRDFVNVHFNIADIAGRYLGIYGFAPGNRK
jgi:glycosyltransferase involved in cell wall biosynthesis